MGFRVRKAWALAILPALALAANTAFASGGDIVLRTDNGADGYYYGLANGGRHISEYLADSYDPGAIICGARVRELNQGTIPPPGYMGGDLRLEDTLNPGYPGLMPADLYAPVDASSIGTCSMSSAVPRIFTFGSGGGVNDPVANHYISALNPTRGTAGIDFCGVLLDTSSAPQRFSKIHNNGAFGTLAWNHFVELLVFVSKRMDLNIRAHGSARFPGDGGIPVVFTNRPNSGGSVTDDNITLTLSIDNGTGGSVMRNLQICADQSVISPAKGLKPITAFFRPVGGGPAIMNPLTLPSGRTILRLEVSQASVKTKAANIVNKKVLNLPLRVLVDDPIVDTDVCRLDGGADIDDEVQRIGLRRRAGSQDDNSAEAFFVVQAPNAPGDSLNVRHKAIDLPKSSTYNVTGFEVVGGEFVGSMLPGLDAVELRTQDPVFSTSPDLSGAGLLRSAGTRDGMATEGLTFTDPMGVGTVPITSVFDFSPNQFIDPTGAAGLVSNLYALAVLNPGEMGTVSAIAADQVPGDTLLGDSNFTTSGILPVSYDVTSNFMVRLLLDGDRSTLDAEPIPAGVSDHAFLRPVGTFVAIDVDGNPIR